MARNARFPSRRSSKISDTGGRRRASRSAGFSLTELMVASVSVTLLFASLHSFYRSQLFAVRTEEVGVNVKEEVDVGIDLLARELRVAGARPEAYPSGGCAGLANPLAPCTSFERLREAGTERVTLQYDYRGAQPTDPPNGCPTDPNERVTYSLAAGVLRRALNGGAAADLVAGVPSGGFSLVYRDASGTVLAPDATGFLAEAQRSAVRTIEVTVRSSAPHPDRSIGGSLLRERSSTVVLRNTHCQG